jgi:hypothetical protein
MCSSSSSSSSASLVFSRCRTLLGGEGTPEQEETAARRLVGEWQFGLCLVLFRLAGDVNSHALCVRASVAVLQIGEYFDLYHYNGLPPAGPLLTHFVASIPPPKVGSCVFPCVSFSRVFFFLTFVVVLVLVG